MHKTLKEATIKPPRETMEAQQEAFESFRIEFNQDRPHQSLNGRRPKDVHTRSIKQMPAKLPEVTYPDNFKIRKVRSNGEAKWQGKNYFLSDLLCGEPIGFEEIDDGRAIVHFASLKLGLIDARKNKIDRA